MGQTTQIWFKRPVVRFTLNQMGKAEDNNEVVKSLVLPVPPQ